MASRKRDGATFDPGDIGLGHPFGKVFLGLPGFTTALADDIAEHCRHKRLCGYGDSGRQGRGGRVFGFRKDIFCLVTPRHCDWLQRESQ